MLYYEIPLTIPANTSQSSSVSIDLELVKGLITSVEVSFPPGCAGLAKVQIKHKLRQVWPTNQEGFFCDDDYKIRFIEDYPLPETPYTLSLIGWNEDDTYPHTVTFRFGLSPLPKTPIQQLTTFLIGEPVSLEGSQ